MAQQATQRLSAGAVHLLSILEGYCAASARTRGEAVAFVSQARLCERLQRSPAAVKRYVAELRAAGLVMVTRGYRALNRYTVSPGTAAPEMSRSNGSEVSPSNGSGMSPSNGSEVSPSNGSGMSRSEPDTIRGDLVFTQLHQHQNPGAAAGKAHAPNAPEAPAGPEAPDAPAQPASWCLFPGKTALEVLTAAGLTETVALDYAQADKGGLCHLAAAYYAERAAKGRCTLGLLRDMLVKPAEYFRADTAGNWLPPRDSMIHRDMRAAEKAVKRAEHQALLSLQAQDAAHREAESKARSAVITAHNRAAWAALSDSDRRGIEHGVGRELPASMSRAAFDADGTETHYRLRCYSWMNRLAAAQAREDAWQAMAPAARAVIEAEARRRFPLWAATDAAALHSICLMLMPEAKQ